MVFYVVDDINMSNLFVIDKNISRNYHLLWIYGQVFGEKSSAEQPNVRQVTEPNPNRTFGRTFCRSSAEHHCSVDH